MTDNKHAENGKIRVGIEAIAFDVPEHYLDMTELANARGVDPAKYIAGLGQRQMAVATPCEDTVALAAGAGQRLIQNFNIDPKSISLLIVGTETGVDHSKPVSSYVHQILGLSTECRVYEVKHACYGAMAGLTSAVNYILSGRAKGRKALVIASDIARYGKNTVGEPTQGAGAVAMLISDNPKLLEIDYHTEGFFATQVMDFWRPLYSKEAFADGHYSIQCYLDALTGAYKLYKRNIPENGVKQTGKFSERFEACLYHVPFVKMAQKAHQRLLETDAGYHFEKDSPEVQAALQDFKKKVAPALELNSRVGNIYTGALFLSLIHLLENSSGISGKSISLFSYGSGCGAEFMSGKVVEGAEQLMKKEPSEKILEKRKLVSMPQYEAILDACSRMDLNGEGICEPEQWNLSRPVVYLGTKDHKRIYRVNGEVMGESATHTHHALRA